MQKLLLLALCAGLPLGLGACGQACRDLPVCLTNTPAERQPLGYLQDGSVTLAPGETRTVTVRVDRNSIPEGQALQLVPWHGEALPAGVLGRSRDGTLTATGSQQPFTGNQTQLSLTAAPDAPPTGQDVTFFIGIRKVESRTDTQGMVSLDVRVQAQSAR
ncbi:hypothetical protein [Deinococcus sp. NW-56]|uniref:hypothetical protein n=1 Tax=Deinococcus sp. NW-56 TaxID=2080419 RepID=UPI000CF4C8D2|nr:hypothetical protein [Deinococcus sp. NW-56]